MRILYVQREPIDSNDAERLMRNQETNTAVLQCMGHSVDYLDNLFSLSEQEFSKYDLLLAHYVGEEGITRLKELREIVPGVGVIMTTSSIFSRDKEMLNSFQRDCDGVIYLMKPYLTNELSRAIEQAVQDARKERVLR